MRGFSNENSKDLIDDALRQFSQKNPEKQKQFIEEFYKDSLNKEYENNPDYSRFSRSK